MPEAPALPGAGVPPRPARFRLRAAAAAVLALALLLVVAVASRSRPAPLAAVPGPPREIGDTVVLLIAAAWLLVIGLTVWAIWNYEVEGEAPDPRPRLGIWSALAQLGLALGLALAWSRLHPRPGLGGLPAVGGAGPRLNPPPAHAAAAAAQGFDWAALAVVGAMIAAAALFLLHRSLTRRVKPPARERLAAVLAAGIAELEMGPDPRRAVIAAYANMEGALAAQGFPRRPSEAPLEYVGRVLNGPGAGGGPARALTGLFEVARFSHHEISSAMRAEALSALREMRAELGGQPG